VKTLLISRKQVGKLLDMADVLDAVEQAFREWDAGMAQMPPKAYVSVTRGDFRAMPASLTDAVGIKWVNVHPENPSLGLPTVMAIIIYNDPGTGYPLAIMDGTEITSYRTGAASAIASKYMARKDSHTLGIIGAGRQAHTQIMAHAQLFNLTLIKVFDQSIVAAEKLIAAFPQLPFRISSLPETARSDIVCTLTPSRSPFLKKEWIVPGTHINAVGADAEGKEELEPSLLKRATVVVDDIKQASSAGEINVPVSKGLFSIKEIYGTLGEIVSGRKPARKDNNAITIFDSTGVAIEDIATARLVYEKAKQNGESTWIDLIEASG
jgi:alanine dehydrogenase